MSILKKIILVLFSCMIIVSFAACKKEGPAERAGEKIDKTIEKAGDKIEEAGDKIKESTKK
jgi:uncharacterized lipoprotein YehR (DUF1307 family)